MTGLGASSRVISRRGAVAVVAPQTSSARPRTASVHLSTHAPHRRVSGRVAQRRAAAGAAAGAASEPATPAAAAGGEDEEFLELPPPTHVLRVDDFAPGLAARLREHFEAVVGGDPRAPPRADRFCFDWWNVPGQFTLLRTPADRFFPPALHGELVDALTAYGEARLGCRGVSPLWLSAYVDGCVQELHVDAPHGPWAFVLSLTRWDSRRFSGGETEVLRPSTLEYWRRFDASSGADAPQLVQLLEPRFGRLNVFDPRLPHGVRRVGGVHDLLDARVVVHGWFAPPAPFVAAGGALGEADVTAALNGCLPPIYEELGALPPLVGAVVARLTVAAADGRVADLEVLTNTLAARAADGGDAAAEALAVVAQHLVGARFPPAAGGQGATTLVTVPFIFD